MTITNSEGKPHFATLDGLRGVAAISVVILHWLDGLGFKLFGSSILAVDFFFMLSGFVVAYSYEDRLKKGFSFLKFMLLRIIRLHPMIILGALLGLIRFQTKTFLGTGELSADYFLKFFTTSLMIPDINALNPLTIVNRDHEYFMINISLWSLYFEFFAYILLGLILFRLNKLTIALISFISFMGIYLWIKAGFGFDVTHEDGIVLGGYTRVLFSFCCGVLIFRLKNFADIIGKKIPAYFLLLLPAFFALPRDIMPWYLYLVSFVIIFPLSIIVGMRIKTEGKVSKISDFLGGISYPLYAIHTPLLWSMGFALKKLGVSDPQNLVWLGFIVIPVTIAISHIVLKIYDEPMRKWLKKKLVS